MSFDLGELSRGTSGHPDLSVGSPAVVPCRQRSMTSAGDAAAPRKAFSLARVQMAAWFYAVLVAYLFLYLVTGALDTISATVLGLMGISAASGGTYVGVKPPDKKS